MAQLCLCVCVRSGKKVIDTILNTCNLRQLLGSRELRMNEEPTSYITHMHRAPNEMHRDSILPPPLPPRSTDALAVVVIVVVWLGVFIGSKSQFNIAHAFSARQPIH